MDWLITAGQYAGSLTAIILLVALIINWVVIKPIKMYIDKATYPIHPDANGGKSLPDAIAGITRIESKIEKIESRLTRLERDHQPIL
jgi:hypothetical protein